MVHDAGFSSNRLGDIAVRFFQEVIFVKYVTVAGKQASFPVSRLQ
jgi:hypothetical protein